MRPAIDLLGVIFLSALMTVALYFWLGNIWACVVILSFVVALASWIFKCTNAVLTGLQLEARERAQTLEMRLTELHSAIVLRLDEIIKALNN
jgi:hypothetical protein